MQRNNLPLAERNIDMKRLGLLAIGLAFGSFTAMAQTDDVYFVPKKSDRINKEYKDRGERDADVYYSGSDRNVDEYNRRNRNGSSYQKIRRDSLGNVIVEEDVNTSFAGRDRDAYDRSRRDRRDYYDDDDYYYSRRVSRFYDPWFFGYYGYSPYYGYSRWDWDWYDPFYYGYGPRWRGYYSYWYNDWAYPYYGYGWRSPYYYGGYYGPYYGYYRPYYGWGTYYTPGYYTYRGGAAGTRNHGTMSSRGARDRTDYRYQYNGDTRSSGRSYGNGYERSSNGDFYNTRSYDNNRNYNPPTRSYDSGSRGGSFGGGGSSRGGGGSFGGGSTGGGASSRGVTFGGRR